MIAEKVAEPRSGTELVGELEVFVIPRVAAESAELDLAAMLRPEGWRRAGQQHCDDREGPHRRAP